MFASKHKLKQLKERVARLRRQGQEIYTDEELEREGLLTEQLLPRHRTLQPTTLPSGSWLLGACDAEFVKGRPTFVDLLVVCEEPLDPGRLVEALQAALDTGFGCVAGQRRESAVEPTGGLRFSHVRAATIATTDSGGAPTLFDSPPRRPVGEPTEVLTVRLTTAPLHCPNQCSLGIVWDHAMCDVGGIALLLAHVSACYAARPSPPPPHHDRSLQRASVAARPVETRGSAEGGKPSEPSEPVTRGDLATPAPTAALREGDHRRRGVGVVVEWACSGEELQLLKAEAVARTRHEALFAEALCLLREAGEADLQPRPAPAPAPAPAPVHPRPPTPHRHSHPHPHRHPRLPPPPTSRTRTHPQQAGLRIATVSISRDDRARVGLPAEHFGNGTLITTATLPPPAAGRAAVAAALRAAIEGGSAVTQLTSAADVHLTSWWHPLQRDLSFGCSAPPALAMGPVTLGVCCRLCGRQGQANLTALPHAQIGPQSEYVRLQPGRHTAAAWPGQPHRAPACPECPCSQQRMRSPTATTLQGPLALLGAPEP